MSEKKRKPTLEQVAKAAGVSRSTASRVVNDDPRTSEASRRKVMAAVKALGYRPNESARKLAGGGSNIISIVIPQAASTIFSEPFYSTLFQGIHDGATSRGYHIMLAIRNSEGDGLKDLDLAAYRDQFVAGLIVTSAQIEDPMVRRLAGMKLPFITIGRNPGHPEIPSVDVDNIMAARKAVAHLFASGRKRIASITGPLDVIPGQDRLSGYQQALKDAGLKYDEKLVAVGDFTEPGGYRAMKSLMPSRLDAVFVASDVMALGALRALKEMNVRVPEDVAVIGFDDTERAAFADPPLTSVRQPIHQMGEVAALLLIDQIEGKLERPAHKVLPTHLIIRRSSGAV